jgi:hypothetical protein
MRLQRSHRPHLLLPLYFLLGCGNAPEASADSATAAVVSETGPAHRTGAAPDSGVRELGARDSIARALLLGTYTLPLDSTPTLASVQPELGTAAIVEPHQHEDFTTICYVGTDPGGAFLLRLQTNDMGGDKRHILGYELRRLTTTATPGKCTPLAQRGDPRSDNGLRLDMPLREALQIEGTPTSIAGGTYVFERSIAKADSTKTPPARYDLVSTIRLEVSNDRVVAIHVFLAAMS